MRLFIALPLSDESVDAIEEWRKPFVTDYSYLRWTKMCNLHITLRFLGNRNPDEVIAEMKELGIEEKLPVRYSFSRVGYFGHPPSVVWLSGRFPKAVFSLAETVASVVDENGKQGRGSSFVPHVTIARAPRGAVCPRFTLDGKIEGFSGAVHLVGSTLTRGGPVYETVYTVGCFV